MARECGAERAPRQRRLERLRVARERRLAAGLRGGADRASSPPRRDDRRRPARSPRPAAITSRSSPPTTAPGASCRCARRARRPAQAGRAQRARRRPRARAREADRRRRPRRTGRAGGEGEGRQAGRAPSSATASAHYDERHDDLPGDATSRLSAHLRFGCVSPLALMQEARERARRRALRAPALLARLPPSGACRQPLPPPPRLPPARRPLVALAAGARGLAAGPTGYPVVDAAMRQLAAEGSCTTGRGWPSPPS